MFNIYMAHHNNGSFGALCEIAFCTAAMERGFKISKPLEPCVYDLILDNGKQLYRVQVKGTRGLSSDNRYSFLCCHGSKSKSSYTNTDIDVIVLYIASDKLFYIIPIDKLRHKRIRLKNNPGEHEYSAYFEGWDLFD